MTHVHEVSIRFPSPLSGAVRADLSQPLPPLPPPRQPAAAPQISQSQNEAQSKADQLALAAAIAGLRNAATQLRMQYESMRKEMRQAAVELAVAVAGRLLHDKARTGEFPLEELIRNVVEKLPDRRDVIVSMHPDDLSLLRQRLGVEHLLAEESTTQFRADAGLTRGACRAEASGVTVLSDLEIQLAILRQEMLENVAHARPKPD